ncbi:pro-resilin-like [Frankliniella occidentalis]|uniref:Pro-resilin-like n=1 Tax=Frankliniella occidentalis TaxID=133901 RepID=A0A6J1RU77_FRAOC|nr:pro-resilin-like [Frankliniella occidentalis]
MAFLKVAVAVSTLLAAVALTRAEPPNNQYLPPTSGGSNGYNYDRPSVPFQPRPPAPTPAYRPSPPPPPPAPRPTYSAPTSTGGYDYNAQANLPQSHGGDHDDHHHEPGMPYDFNYAVKDDYYGTDYSRNEVSDGNVITGEYRVQLPDGRLQIVRYTADWQNGYNADVSYEGEAKYPEPKLNQGSNVNQYQPQQNNGGYQYRRK